MGSIVHKRCGGEILVEMDLPQVGTDAELRFYFECQGCGEAIHWTPKQGVFHH